MTILRAALYDTRKAYQGPPLVAHEGTALTSGFRSEWAANEAQAWTVAQTGAAATGWMKPSTCQRPARGWLERLLTRLGDML